MKNAGLAGAIALCGIGLMMIGLGNFVKAPSAMAYTPAVTAAVQDKGEPTIVWYGVTHSQRFSEHRGSNGPNVLYTQADSFTVLCRAWSDGVVEAKKLCSSSCSGGFGDSGWTVVSSPNEGLNAAADITFDEVVDGQDLATLLASWGPAPRNPMPPSDCPLGLMN